tara:strand:+ start:434 stop:613 length:180 start_codon:yes stop_codon:yes gene_type:complete
MGDDKGPSKDWNDGVFTSKDWNDGVFGGGGGMSSYSLTPRTKRGTQRCGFGMSSSFFSS